MVEQNVSVGDISRVAGVPAGFEIMYVPKPRGYFLRRNETDAWSEKVPSVTTVTDLLEKGGLSWWGMTTAVEGVLKLYNMGAIQGVVLPGHDRPTMVSPGAGGAVVAGVDEIVEQLQKFKLDVNQVRDSAGKRGTTVHDAFELWAKEGLRPDPKIFPDEEQGYIRALNKFLDDVPSMEPEGFEVMVGSLEHEYAGRFDFRGKTNVAHEVCKRVTDTRAEYYAVLPPGRGLIDLKTSKDVYIDQSRQLEGYEIAAVESGYPATDWRAILNVQSDGLYQLVRSHGEADDFLVVLELYRSLERMKARKKADPRGKKR